MRALDLGSVDNGVENRIRTEGTPQPFDITADRKGDPIQLTGTFYNQFAGFEGSFKGNLHNHVLPRRWGGDVENARTHYAERGYDFFGAMDHDEVVHVPDLPDLITIPGMELSLNAGHLLTFGLDDFTFPTADDPEEEDLKRIRSIHDRGGLAVLAHPNKTAYTWEQLQQFCDAGLIGLEVVNSGVTGKTADTGKFDQGWKLLLQAGRYLVGLGNDDAHGPHTDLSEWGGVPQVAWTGVFADALTQTEIINAIKYGRTYVSQGPRIDSIEFVPEAAQLRVECSEAVACHFRGIDSYGGDTTTPDEGLQASTFSLDLAERGYRIRDYVSVIVEDAKGRRAWTTPIPVDITEKAR